MTTTPFSRRRSVPLGALAVLAVVLTSGCGVQGARGHSSWASNTDGSVSNPMLKAAYGEAPQETVDGTDLAVQEPVEEKPKEYKFLTYDDAVSKFGMSVDKNAFGSHAGEGFIGFRLGESGIFLGMFDADPADDRGVVSDVLASEAN